MLAFAIGTGGGVAMKMLGTHPFITAAFSALVLCLYALLTYASTPLRLEPEVIGDNAYYLGFLFTLTSLSVTLYFVVQAGAEDRARLIPEFISGFGVALVSTNVGVFVRVLMMQFRLDIVARERETRVQIDEGARLLRVEMAMSLQQIKLFTVESLQHSAERESEFRRATDAPVKATQKALTDTARFLQQETATAFREQNAAAIESLRATIAGASEAALQQISTSFEEIGKTSEGLRDNHAQARSAVEQANATLHQQTAALADEVEQLAGRIRAASGDIADAGDALPQGFATVRERMVQSSATVTGQGGTPADPETPAMPTEVQANRPWRIPVLMARPVKDPG